MGCNDGLRQAEADAKLQPQLNRIKKAETLLVYFAGIVEAEKHSMILETNGNHDILKRKKLAKELKSTFAQLASYDADYEESKLCAAIRNYGAEKFMKLIVPELATSASARDLLTWWETHKSDDLDKLDAEILHTKQKINNAENLIRKQKAILKDLLTHKAELT